MPMREILGPSAAAQVAAVAFEADAASFRRDRPPTASPVAAGIARGKTLVSVRDRPVVPTRRPLPNGADDRQDL